MTEKSSPESRTGRAVPAKLAYSIDEACEASGVGRTLLYDEIGQGKLTARKIGRRTVILRADLEAWLAELPCGLGRCHRPLPGGAGGDSRAA